MKNRTRSKNRKATEALLAAAEMAARYAEGDDSAGTVTVVAIPDVRAIRRKLGLSQGAFAQRFGLNVRTIQDWEQGRKVPEQSARVLLRVIASSPGVVARALAA